MNYKNIRYNFIKKGYNPFAVQVCRAVLHELQDRMMPFNSDAATT